ncbi:MAG: amidohydrolase family protein [Chloroflexi bacterium]|nr:amidohydrolase family protein [Chloroflexota bacterium]
MEDLTIRNGQVVTPNGMVKGGLSASNGIITTVGVDASLPKAREEVDAGGKIILPGTIDPHLHLGYPTRAGKGEAIFASDFDTESQAAAASGVTTIISTALFWGAAGKSNMACVKRAKDIGREQSLVDFRITAYILNPQHIAEVSELLNEGITSFKFLTAYRGEEARQVGISDVTWGLVYQGFEAISKLPRPAMAMLHAENVDLMEVFSERVKKSGRSDLAAWTDTRPGLCEELDILISGAMAKELGLRLYYPHIGSNQAMEAIGSLCGQGAELFVETCPHYLTFTVDSPLGALGKVNPPLRTADDVEGMWEAASMGLVDTLGTDHVVTSAQTQNKDELWKSTPGFSSLGLPLPILTTYGLENGLLTWQQIAEMTSENVARLFGMYPTKGVLAPGSDADIIIVDPEAKWKVNHKDWLKTSDFCIYDGMELKGKVGKTFVRGKLVGENMKAVAQKPWGKFVEPVLE